MPPGAVAAPMGAIKEERFASLDLLRSQGIHEPFDRISRKAPDTSGDDLRLAPYQVLWITEA